jgi:putative membrane protein
VLHEVGAHYTYSEVPWREWLHAVTGSDALDGGAVGSNHYDRFVHFCYGLLIFPAVWELFDARTSPRGLWRHLMPVLFVMSHSVIYEMTGGSPEPFGARSLPRGTGDVWDAQKDMALATRGALPALLWGGVCGRIRGVWRTRRIRPLTPL